MSNSVEETLDDELDDDHPLCLVNGQIEDLLEGIGASEDHEDVIAFLLATGLPRRTVDRMHNAIVRGDTKVLPSTNGPDVVLSQDPVKLQFPTMLRKMWSGGEVQDWLDAQGPLYAHPVPACELTDEDIENIHKSATNGPALAPNRMLSFARAIERFLKGESE